MYKKYVIGLIMMATSMAFVAQATDESRPDSHSGRFKANNIIESIQTTVIILKDLAPRDQSETEEIDKSIKKERSDAFIPGYLEKIQDPELKDAQHVLLFKELYDLIKNDYKQTLTCFIERLAAPGAWLDEELTYKLLICAAGYGRVECLEMLLAYFKAQFTKAPSSSDLYDALEAAIMMKKEDAPEQHEQCIDLLIAQGADINGPPLIMTSFGEQEIQRFHRGRDKKIRFLLAANKGSMMATCLAFVAQATDASEGTAVVECAPEDSLEARRVECAPEDSLEARRKDKDQLLRLKRLKDNPESWKTVKSGWNEFRKLSWTEMAREFKPSLGELENYAEKGCYESLNFCFENYPEVHAELVLIYIAGSATRHGNLKCLRLCVNQLRTKSGFVSHLNQILKITKGRCLNSSQDCIRELLKELLVEIAFNEISKSLVTDCPWRADTDMLSVTRRSGRGMRAGYSEVAKTDDARGLGVSPIGETPAGSKEKSTSGSCRYFTADDYFADDYKGEDFSDEGKERKEKWYLKTSTSAGRTTDDTEGAGPAGAGGPGFGAASALETFGGDSCGGAIEDVLEAREEIRVPREYLQETQNADFSIQQTIKGMDHLDSSSEKKFKLACVLAEKGLRFSLLRLLALPFDFFNQVDSDGLTLLMHATKNGNISCAEFIVRELATRCQSEYSQAHLKLKPEYYQEYLMKEDSSKRTALQYLDEEWRTYIPLQPYTKLLAPENRPGAQKKDHQKRRDLTGKTLEQICKPQDMFKFLCLCAANGYLKSLKYCLEQGADLNGKDEHGYTIFMYAVMHKNVKCCELIRDCFKAAHGQEAFNAYVLRQPDTTDVRGSGPDVENCLLKV